MRSIASWRLLFAAIIAIAPAAGRVAAQPAGRAQPPAFVSPEVSPDRRIVFRIYAPRAESVRLNAGDIPGVGGGGAMKKDDNGVWELTVDPVPPGAYRYTFNVDGVATVDPRSPATSESNNNAWSLVLAPGSELMDTKSVPHGAVAAVTYYSSVLARFRRMHVYTPPGYESGKGRYPVFYLLHGASDSDDSWSSVGRAPVILDNLIAAKKAVPMIVVMPAGHTRNSFTVPPPGAPRPPADEFEQEFLHDILPYVEANYRSINDRAHRAIAGLSMGGGQTLNLLIPNQEKFAYAGVFSSGLFGAFPNRRPGAEPPAPDARSPYEDQHKAELDNAQWKRGLKLVWFSTGRDDRLMPTTQSTVALLKRHGFDVHFQESAGGHTWLNWRDYLSEFAPLLFR
ncbi:MAG TPA: alpha/beta hydrolase-fold protein [Chthonomonadaceae bacterium]|nr:alpha/beta hydrolase-fold protein [Chthonomonadaceae bacterium]